MLRLGLQGPSRPQELCAGTLPGHDAGRCGTGRRRRACGAGKPGGRAVSVTAPVPAVRGQAFSCPWLPGSRGARTCSGRRRPQTCLAARIRWSARLTRVEGERSVKPSAQPTLVRTQHLPPPAKTARWLRKRGPAGRFLLVTPCVKVRHYGSRRGSVHVHMVYSVRAKLAVRITAPLAGPRPFCPIMRHPGFSSDWCMPCKSACRFFAVLLALGSVLTVLVPAAEAGLPDRPVSSH